MKPFKSIIIVNKTEQEMMVTPSENNDGIKVYLYDIGDTNKNPFYIEEDELKYFIGALTEIMNYSIEER